MSSSPTATKLNFADKMVVNGTDYILVMNVHIYSRYIEGEYRLDKTHCNFANSFKLVIVQFSTNEVIVSKMRLLTPS